MSEVALAATAVTHSFGPVAVLEDVTFQAARGEFVAIIGPSGCGKSTLLNVLSGSLEPSSGTVERSGITRTIHQQGGLFPWLTVAQNIDMGLPKSLDPSERERQREQLIILIRLQGFEQSYPHQISGGMQQRVELARAIAGNSDTLLMDEPFSALDYQTRLRMRLELVRLLNETPRTVVFVTHDIEEAVQLADRVVVLSDRPARVRYELRMTTPKPRKLSNEEVLEAIEHISRDLGLEELGLEPMKVAEPRVKTS